MKIDLCIATLHPPLAEQAVARAQMYATGVVGAKVYDGENHGVPAAYYALSQQSEADILLFMHDDVWLAHWRWDEVLARHFEAYPRCAVAGFSGARGLGHPDLHSLPFSNELLARRDFASALADAEVHGRRLAAPQRCVQCDGYAIAVRGEWLRQAQPWAEIMWSGFPYFHHYDTALCLLALEQRNEVWALPINCRHLGGRTSLSAKYKEWQTQTGLSDGVAHDQGHQVLMERFGSMLPVWA